MSRKIAREVAMKLVFAQMLGGEDTYEAVLDQSDIPEAPSEEDFDYANGVMQGIENQKANIDNLIEQYAIGWTIDRMARVDLCVLRIAIYEMLYRADVPDSVAINEAVELAKRFGGEHSSAYINGILGTISRKKIGADLNGEPC